MWTRRLAEFIVEADVSVVDAGIRRKAARVVADTVGCMVAGLPSDTADVLRAYTQRPQWTTLDAMWGTGRDAEDAERLALTGGALGAALDYDDVSAIGHPSSILMSSILSTDLAALRGRDVLDAYLVGYEVTTRLAQAIQLPHTRYGWHATSTSGYFGAMAVAARLYGLTVEQTMNAVGATASMAAGMARNFGTMTKPLHSGLAARGGLTAAGLARVGLTAGADVLDGDRGYLAMYGLDQADPTTLGALGAPWAMEERSPSLKRFPSCYASHRPIDAILAIQAEHDFAVEDVDRIVLRAPLRATGGLPYADPRTGLEGKFSATYPVAAAFLDRDVTISSFADERVLRSEVRSLIAKMDVAEDPRCLPEDPEGVHANPIEGGFWEITVHARDGRTVVATAAEPPGSPNRQLPTGVLRAKFVDCAVSAGNAEAPAGAVFDALVDIDAQTDVRALLGALVAREETVDA